MRKTKAAVDGAAVALVGFALLGVGQTAAAMPREGCSARGGTLYGTEASQCSSGLMCGYRNQIDSAGEIVGRFRKTVYECVDIIVTPLPPASTRPPRPKAKPNVN